MVAVVVMVVVMWLWGVVVVVVVVCCDVFVGLCRLCLSRHVISEVARRTRVVTCREIGHND